ncbi:FAD binding domain-containing protein [Hirsutella rhossiliensis]|uniref:FAD binding domain-containing protein n=1 Tax=Hirsutella rhossiliensis TaxID=111463 RepID=A0A9P8MNH5_9HYPO|nr:FAD binding domain-containing protein [Hirsutella rhossiliensis]KAH0958207.1 FAD binding domain-containing protein [Hirsutella rhossiliensis]
MYFDSESYDCRNESYFSRTAQLAPWAIVQPRNTDEVSRSLKALVRTPGCKFAVRSGGHMQWAGANNIRDGITIDLGRTWADAYKELEKHGRMVAGGRDGAVGIGGLLTGGGKTFYTCRTGFACDQVVNYEVVLANGTVIEANDQKNSDIFRVLKGGGNNFGIVTRFDIATFPSKDIWDGNIIYDKEITPQLAEVLLDFIQNLAKNPDSHVAAAWTYLPKTENHFINMFLTNLDGDKESRSLSKFLAIPGKREMKMSTVATKVASSALGAGLPTGKENTWFSLTFKADSRIVLRAAEVFEATVGNLKAQVPDYDFVLMMLLQPLPIDCLLLLFVLQVETSELRTTIGLPALKGAIDEIEAFAESMGGNVRFRYLNYCDGSQDPLYSYGEKNVEMMRIAAAKYDPSRVFQTQVPGGFKISKVK